MLIFQYKKTDGTIAQVEAFSDLDAISKVGASSYDKDYGFVFYEDTKIIELSDNFNVTDNEFPAFDEAPTIIYKGLKTASLNFTDQTVLFDGMTLRVENQSNFIFTVTCEHSTEDVLVKSGKSVIIEYLSKPNRFIEFSNEEALKITKDDSTKIITINGQKLDLSSWFASVPHSGGKQPQPQAKKPAYFGFSASPTIDEAGALKLNSKEIFSASDNFSSSQNNPPNYFYIVMPDEFANNVKSIAQSPSILGSDWDKQKLTINGHGYTAFKSPHKMFDSYPTFKTL